MSTHSSAEFREALDVEDLSSDSELFPGVAEK
jgi:hypothetical protein